jgi:hypothetical protein
MELSGKREQHSMHIERKQLPHGDWFTMVNLPFDVTIEDIQGFIHTRTGLYLPSEHISRNEPLPGTKNCASAMISLDRFQVKEILEWAFDEDTIRGSKVRWLIPERKR